MKKNILLSILIALCNYQVASAQSFDDLTTNSEKNLFTEGWLKIMFQHTTLSGTYTDAHSGPALSMGLRRESDQKYGWRWDFEYTAMNYAFNMLYNVIKDKSLNQYYDHTLFSSGIAGWHKATINVVATDRLLISPGFSAGDHYIGTKLNGTSRIIDVVGYENYLGGSTQNINPTGWYVYAGPAIKASYVVSNKIWIDAYANYDFTLAKLTSPSDNYKKTLDYPKPTVLMYGADVYSTYGVFAGLRLASLKDSGSHKNDAKRVDISVGYQF